MESKIGIKEMLKLAIAMEDDGVNYYTAMAEKSDDYHESMIYKPQKDKLTWSEDKGFYVELAKKVMGEGYAPVYQMPDKITHEDTVSFYYGLGKTVLEDVKSVLMGMADDEKRHGALFRKWLAGIDDETESHSFSPEAAAFFEKYSENLTFNPKERAPATIAEAIDDAIETEGGAVDFYNGMLKYASPEVAPLMEKIVNEEKGHKTKLEAQKAKLDALMN